MSCFAWDRKTFKATDGKEILPIYFLKKAGGRAPLEGDVITDASNDYDDRGRPEVTMNMNPEGARKWKNLTAANVGRPVAILLDNLVYTAPNVQNEIPNGRSSISGNFTVEETKDMANVLKAGKLPAPTNIVEESVVGATLGSEAVSAGVLSSIIGILLVLAFVVFYYNRAGLIADIALFVNLFFLMGVMASLGAVLTMPGIAGIVLSIGMAVDANVLIFERIKEELALGKTFKAGRCAMGSQNALFVDYRLERNDLPDGYCPVHVRYGSDSGLCHYPDHWYSDILVRGYFHHPPDAGILHPQW